MTNPPAPREWVTSYGFTVAHQLRGPANDTTRCGRHIRAAIRRGHAADVLPRCKTCQQLAEEHP